MARYFDGVDDTIVSFKNTGVTSYNWIVACWFRTNVASGKLIVSAENSRTSSVSYAHPVLYVGTDGYLRWGAWDGAARVVVTSFTVIDNVWRMVIGTCQWNNSVKMWVNGNFIGSTTLGTYSDATCWWKLGSYKGSGFPNAVNGYFPGEVADVRIYRLPLSVSITDGMVEAIIKSMYHRNPALRQYLYIWYPLWERGTPSHVLDHSSRYDNGELFGTNYVDDPVQLAGSLVTP